MHVFRYVFGLQTDKKKKKKYEKFSKLAFEPDKIYINAKPGRKKTPNSGDRMQLPVVYNTGIAGVPRIHLDIRVPHMKNTRTHTRNWMKYDVTYAPTLPAFMTDAVSSRLISFNAIHTEIPFSRWPFPNLSRSFLSLFPRPYIRPPALVKSSHTTLHCHHRSFPSLMYVLPFRGS